jgi:ribonuclease G
MTKELVISSNRHETKVALIEDDQLVEIYFQRSNEYSLVGSIHKGRVTRVLPGMQSAFVELGLDRDAFLYVSDFLEQTGEDYERVAAGEEPKPEPRGGGGRRDRDRPPRAAMLPVVTAAPAPVVLEAVVVPSPIAVAAAATGAVVPEEQAAQPQPQQPNQPGADRDRDGRRGRNRRRRRRGGRGPGGTGLPESKFASPGDTETHETDDDEGVEAGEEAVRPLPAAFVPVREPELEPLVLPGESIAKYRRGEAEEREEPQPEPVIAAQPVEPEPVPLPVAVVEPEPEPEPEPEIAAQDPIEEAEVRELVADHIEAHQLAIEEEEAAAAATGIVIDEEESPDEDSAEEADGESEVDDEVDAMQEAAEAALAASGDAPAVAAQAGVREEQPTARYIQRRDRGRRRGGRNGGGGGGGGSRSGGGERYDTVPRTEPVAGVVVTGEAAAAPAPRQERERPRDRGDRPPTPSISDLLKEGQEIIVQIYKEPLGQKGARITSHVAMPGRFVVFMPTADHHGVSRKLGNDEERQRLKRIVQANSQGMVGGFIVRTAGEGKPEAEIAADMSNLYNQWLDIRKKAEKRRAPCLLHSDLELVSRTLRDQINDNYKAIWTDSEEMYEMIVGFLELFQPALVPRVKMYSREAPIFDTFNITAELEKALRPKVWLKSGGYIVINQTEALVAIDINTGKFVGKSNRLEDTIVKTNVEAVKEIVRQIRLRDLGGIIVVDFIDMEERKNRQKVMQALEEAMGADRAPYKILQFNDFGLVAITRRRVKQSLERALCSSCPTCEGAGYVKSVQTVMSEILIEAHKLRPGLEGKDVLLRVNPEVAKSIKSASESYLKELEETLGRVVIVKSDPLLHPEKFDLA